MTLRELRYIAPALALASLGVCLYPDPTASRAESRTLGLFLPQVIQSMRMLDVNDMQWKDKELRSKLPVLVTAPLLGLYHTPGHGGQPCSEKI